MAAREFAIKEFFMIRPLFGSAALSVLSHHPALWLDVTPQGCVARLAGPYSKAWANTLTANRKWLTGDTLR